MKLIKSPRKAVKQAKKNLQLEAFTSINNQKKEIMCFHEDLAQEIADISGGKITYFTTYYIISLKKSKK